MSDDGRSDLQGRFGVAEALHSDAHAVHEGEMEAAEFAVGFLAEVVVLAALDRAAASAGEHDRQLA